MKTKRNFTALLLIFACIVLVFASCTYTSDPDHGVCTLVISDGETETVFRADLSQFTVDEGAMSLIRHLAETENLTYRAEEGMYGAFLTEIGQIAQDPGNGVYLGVWTSVEKDYDVSIYATTVEYRGATLVSSGVGLSSMTIEDGAVIYIGYIRY